MNTPRKLTPLNFPRPTMPSELPDRIWMVVRPSGERDFLHREPLEGLAEWTKGLPATVVEYRFSAVVHTPPPKKKEGPKP